MAVVFTPNGRLVDMPLLPQELVQRINEGRAENEEGQGEVDFASTQFLSFERDVEFHIFTEQLFLRAGELALAHLKKGMQQALAVQQLSRCVLARRGEVPGELMGLALVVGDPLAKVRKALPPEPVVALSNDNSYRFQWGEIRPSEIHDKIMLAYQAAANILATALELPFAPTAKNLREVVVRDRWYRDLLRELENITPLPAFSMPPTALAEVLVNGPDSEELQQYLLNNPTGNNALEEPEITPVWL